MKVLFVGQLEPSGWISTTKMRMAKLEALGHQAVPVDYERYAHWGGRLLGGIARRLKWGPPFRRLNRDLLDAARKHRPELVWIEKGIWIFPGTLKRLRSGCGCFLVHYTPDPAITFHRSRHFQASIAQYDLMVTTKRYELELYNRYGARELLLQYPSYDEDVHRPERPTFQEQRRYGADTVFVGTYTAGRERYLSAVARMDVDLAIWGGRWSKCRHALLRRYVRGGSVGGRDYALALGCAKIGLGLLTPIVPDRSTTRSLEIPACGTLLMAERTEEHLTLFEEGEEAVFFASEDELVEKVRHYLHHDEQRKRIAAAGHRRCLRSGYGNLDRVREIMQRVQHLMTR